VRVGSDAYLQIARIRVGDHFDGTTVERGGNSRRHAHSLEVVSYAQYATRCAEDGTRQPTSGCEIGMCIAMIPASDDAKQFSHEMLRMRPS
jgi:hypothetical protein